MADEDALGYIRYEGGLVEDGLMDARRQAKALLGVDSALRYFLGTQSPQLRDLEFEIPVRVSKGSWEAEIPRTVGEWAQAGLITAAGAYGIKAAQTMAANDFKDVGARDLFRGALRSVQWFARMGMHLGDLTIRQFAKVEFHDSGALIGIPNEAGEVLLVPKWFLDQYEKCPVRLLEPIAEQIEDGRELHVGVAESSGFDEVVVTRPYRGIFCREEDEEEEDQLFPELEHGMKVQLEGEVTRENKTSNSMGFKYKGHILTAYPESGDIVPYKPMLFEKCVLQGFVDRIDEKGRIGLRRPKLIFSGLTPLGGAQADGLF